MNKNILFLLLSAFITAFSSSLAQSNISANDEQNGSYSSIDDDAEQPNAIAPCETTLSLVSSTELYTHTAKYKQYITLEKGQELVVYVDNPYHARNANVLNFDPAKPYKNGGSFSDCLNDISCKFFTLNWGGWNNFFDRICSLEEEKDLNTDGDPLSYHFKATHSGVTKLIFTHEALSFDLRGGVIEVTVK